MPSALEIAIGALRAIDKETTEYCKPHSEPPRSAGEVVQVVGAMADHELNNIYWAMRCETGGVPVPWEIIKAMAMLDIVDNHDDNGPGDITCEGCGGTARMIWRSGEREHEKELKHLMHSANCPRQFALGIVKFAPGG